MRPLLRAALLISIPLLFLPLAFTRKVSAKRHGPRGSIGRGAPDTTVAVSREPRIQAIVDELRERLSISDVVEAAIVPANALVVSVERAKGPGQGFRLLLEDDFTGGLSDEEVAAVVAHELGHVWIFTHHPYLHTEELANEVALRLVDRKVLSGVYEKVWARMGSRGNLTYLPVE